MTWTFTGPKASLEMIAACSRGKLTGMIERIQIPRPHGIDYGEVMYALDLGFFQSAECAAAHGTKSNRGNDVRRVPKSLEAPAFRDGIFQSHCRLEALWVLLPAQGKETRAAHEPLTANRWRTPGRALERKARPRRAHARSRVVRLSVKNRRRAF
jgi:hypothetical protein